MKRDLTKLSNKVFDILIIGGGIYGACTAWDAAFRGLSVALIDKGDFGHATSANSLKIIHSGFRYLQHVDIKRMRESIRESMILMKIAPHLIHPLPCVIPTFGHGINSKASLFFALMINDIIGFDRNRMKDPQKLIPRGKIVSKKELNQLIPGFKIKKITGGAIWYDGIVFNSERLTLSFIRSAEKAGSTMANYVKAENFIQKDRRVTGITAKDIFTGKKFDIRAKYVINTTGPWVNEILENSKEEFKTPQFQTALAFNLIIKRQITQKYAMGIFGRAGSEKEIQNSYKKSQVLFLVPWRDCCLIGTKYLPFNGNIDDCKLPKEEIQIFLDEINSTYPGISIKLDEVSFFHTGILPADGINTKTGQVRLIKHYKIIDHLKLDGIDGLISVVGVKLTTARGVAEKTIDLIFKKMKKKPSKVRTTAIPIYGGNINRYESFLNREVEKRPYDLSEKTVRHLIYNYGSQYEDVLKYLDKDINLGKTLHGTSETIKAQVIHAVHEEMALKLADVVFRRTELGTAGNPGDKCLKACADIMAVELKWDEERTKRELNEVKTFYSPKVRML